MPVMALAKKPSKFSVGFNLATDHINANEL